MTLSAVLLAGGESRRMGSEKATLLFNGEPLWRRQLAILRKLQPAKLFLSAKTAPPWQPPETELLLDEAPSRGPISGLAAALKRMNSSHLLVLAVDMPFVTAEDLRELLRRSSCSGGAVPVSGDRAEPLASVYPREAEVAFRKALGSNNTSLQPLVRQLASRGMVQLVALEKIEAERFRSVNYPCDIVRRVRCIL